MRGVRWSVHVGKLVDPLSLTPKCDPAGTFAYVFERFDVRVTRPRSRSIETSSEFSNCKSSDSMVIIITSNNVKTYRDNYRVKKFEFIRGENENFNMKAETMICRGSEAPKIESYASITVTNLMEIGINVGSLKVLPQAYKKTLLEPEMMEFGDRIWEVLAKVGQKEPTWSPYSH
ncbi:hypothetical protein Scep_016972 [Stephania cephalantha]|uniref:Uncharacterized protein n=1 Tax=Stephania cephalantha TaxID=152367 RepID=A0AAP0INQ3_9MAGN